MHVRRDAVREEALEAERRRHDAHKPEHAISLLGVDTLSIDVGEDLLALLEPPAGPALLARIASVRRAIARELGLVMPGVRVADDLRLPPRRFAIRVRDRLVAEGTLQPDRALTLGAPAALSPLAGDAVSEPAYDIGALWQSAPPADALHETGPTDGTISVDALAVLTSTLARVVRGHAAELLGRQEVQLLLDHLKQTHPAVVKGVVPEQISLSLVQRVLQHLVRERVSIRDIGAIVELIADESETTRDASIIGEAARRRLAPSICAALSDAANRIEAAALSMSLESRLAGAIVVVEKGPLLGLEPSAASGFAQQLQVFARKAAPRATIVCSQSLRLPLARFVEALGADIGILGLAEVVPGYTVHISETIDDR